MKDHAAWTEYCKNLSPAIAEACSQAGVSAGPPALVRELGRLVPEWHFRHVLERGGWYRLGGVVDAQGQRLAASLEPWIAGELAARGGDIAQLLEDYAERPLYATRLVGRTHYLVSTTGDGAGDFLQLEIEDLQEVRAHRLFADAGASTLEDLIDPRLGNAPLQPLALPVYAFRRLTHVGAYLERMLVQNHEPAPIHRFLDDWQASSAGRASLFCNHWVMAMREHIDRYQQIVFRAQPIATLNGEPPEFPDATGLSGVALDKALAAFDRAAGYPMAWYFHMLTSKAVPHRVAQTVVEDALGGDFAYLPQRDIDVVRHWLHRPYAP